MVWEGRLVWEALAWYEVGPAGPAQLGMGGQGFYRGLVSLVLVRICKGGSAAPFGSHARPLVLHGCYVRLCRLYLIGIDNAEGGSRAADFVAEAIQDSLRKVGTRSECN